MTSVTYQLNAFFLPIHDYYTSKVNGDTLSVIMIDVENMIQKLIEKPCDTIEFVDFQFDTIIGYKANSMMVYRLTETDNDSEKLKIMLQEQLAYYKSQPQFSELFQSLALVYNVNFNTISLLKGYNSTAEFIHYPDFIDWLNNRIRLEFCILAAVVIHQKKLQPSVEKIKELAHYISYIALQFDSYTQSLVSTLSENKEKKMTFAKVENHQLSLKIPKR